MVLWLNVWNKELLTLRNFFVVTKKFLKAKFDCILQPYIDHNHISQSTILIVFNFQQRVAKLGAFPINLIIFKGPPVQFWSPCCTWLTYFSLPATVLCLRRFAQRKSIPFVAWRSWILVWLTYLVGAWLAIFYTTFFNGLHGRERLLCCVFRIVFVLFLILGFGWLGCHHWCRLKKG